MPLDLAKFSSVEALAVVHTSLLVSFTPIIGVAPSLPQARTDPMACPASRYARPSWRCEASSDASTALPIGSFAGREPP